MHKLLMANSYIKVVFGSYMPTDIFMLEIEGNFRSCAALFICIKLNKYHKVSCVSACAELTSAQ